MPQLKIWRGVLVYIQDSCRSGDPLNGQSGHRRDAAAGVDASGACGGGGAVGPGDSVVDGGAQLEPQLSKQRMQPRALLQPVASLLRLLPDSLFAAMVAATCVTPRACWRRPRSCAESRSPNVGWPSVPGPA